MIYLDNSATTNLSEEARTAMLQAYDEVWGNPSSVHSMGINSKKLLESSRNTIMKALNLTPSDGKIIFCGSGTEANNLALYGIAHAKKRVPRRIITDDSQHPSVLQTLKALSESGFEIVKIPTENGTIDIEALIEAVNDDTLAVSIMTVNNETGALYDTKTAFYEVHKKNPNVITHTDAVQAFNKIQISKKETDLITVSGHKIHAPKGIGALFVSERLIKSKNISPQLFGGGQESGLRAGTENVAAAAAFARASETLFDYSNARERYEQIIKGLPDKIKLNKPQNYVPYIISLTLPRIKSETAVRYLSERGIYISSGSACSSNSAHRKNYVLSAFGLKDYEVESTVRISLGGSETESDISMFLSALDDCIKNIVKMK